MIKVAEKVNPQIVAQFLNSKNINEIVSGRNAILAFERKEGTATLTKGLNENAAALKTLLVNSVCILSQSPTTWLSAFSNQR